MTVYTIELNDAGLLVGVAGQIVLRSPGYALINGSEIATGEKAFSQCRLHPRRMYNRFWSQLSLDPLTHATHRFRHNADLAHAHLMHIAGQLDDGAEVIFAVPGAYTREQLSLLLGIAQETPLKVIGLIDMAVAGAAMQTLESRVLVLDIQLHQSVITELRVADKISRQQVEVVKSIGLTSLYDGWVHLVADTFIEQCRFDPLHDAATEQALYQQLPQWLAAVCSRDEVMLEIRSASAHYQARLSRGQVQNRALASYQQLTTHLARMRGVTDECQLLVTERLACLPGIAALLVPWQRLTESAALEGCGSHLEQIRSNDGSLGFITALPCLTVNTSPVITAQQPVIKAQPSVVPSLGDVKIATHLLQGGDAHPLGAPLYMGVVRAGDRLVITRQPHQLQQLYCSLASGGTGFELRVHNDSPVRVNGKNIEQSLELKVGDEIILGPQGERLSIIGEVGYGASA